MTEYTKPRYEWFAQQSDMVYKPLGYQAKMLAMREAHDLRDHPAYFRAGDKPPILILSPYYEFSEEQMNAFMARVPYIRVERLLKWLYYPTATSYLLTQTPKTTTEKKALGIVRDWCFDCRWEFSADLGVANK